MKFYQTLIKKLLGINLELQHLIREQASIQVGQELQERVVPSAQEGLAELEVDSVQTLILRISLVLSEGEDDGEGIRGRRHRKKRS